jgi:hypothetical protein
VAHDKTPRRVPALVLGKSITALGALRMMAGHGLKTYGVEATSDIITASRWYTPTPRRLPETADGAELGAFLESLALPETVMIACSDTRLFGTERAFIESPQAARTSVEQASERGVTFMLQEWIRGA